MCTATLCRQKAWPQKSQQPCFAFIPTLHSAHTHTHVAVEVCVEHITAAMQPHTPCTIRAVSIQSAIQALSKTPHTLFTRKHPTPCSQGTTHMTWTTCYTPYTFIRNTSYCCRLTYSVQRTVYMYNTVYDTSVGHSNVCCPLLPLFFTTSTCIAHTNTFQTTASACMCTQRRAYTA